MRIVLADDQSKVLFALHTLLKRYRDFVIVGEASNADELILLTSEIDPDLIILDWQLPGLKKIGSLSAIRDCRSNLVIIVLSGRPELSQLALDAGADAFVSKIDPPERLIGTIARFQGTANNVHSSTS
jgi:DNA-binding NarL/FixJ family response regulator